MDEEIRLAVAGNVRAELARHGISQRQVGDVIGVSQAQVSLRLLGRIDFDAVELLKLAAYLHLPVERFLQLDNQTSRPAQQGTAPLVPTPRHAGALADPDSRPARGEDGSPATDPQVGEPHTPPARRHPEEPTPGPSAAATPGGPDTVTAGASRP